MRKIFEALVLLLAINFLAVAGGVGWLYQSGHLDRERVKTIKELVFPAPIAEAPATQPAGADAPPPAAQRLAELLARRSGGKMTSEKVESIQQSFDVAFAQLDRREREAGDREQQVARANARLAEDRKALEDDRQRLIEQGKQADKLAADKGFQDTLNLYSTMNSKQVKSLFMTMEESAAADYLDAMTPRLAAKILKEFKTAGETDRVKRILGKMRHPPGAADATTPDSKENTDASSR
jgi:flagellar motility protein MotE (MotC chaperone)